MRDCLILIPSGLPAAGLFWPLIGKPMAAKQEMALLRPHNLTLLVGNSIVSEKLLALYKELVVILHSNIIAHQTVVNRPRHPHSRLPRMPACTQPARVSRGRRWAREISRKLSTKATSQWLQVWGATSAGESRAGTTRAGADISTERQRG